MMADYSSVKAALLGIIEKYAFDKDRVRNAGDDSRIVLDLKINSARIVDIILDIEEKFGIEIDNASIEKMVSVRNVVEIIQQKLND